MCHCDDWSLAGIGAHETARCWINRGGGGRWRSSSGVGTGYRRAGHAADGSDKGMSNGELITVLMEMVLWIKDYCKICFHLLIKCLVNNTIKDCKNGMENELELSPTVPFL